MKLTRRAHALIDIVLLIVLVWLGFQIGSFFQHIVTPTISQEWR